MVERVRWLLDRPAEHARLANAAHAIVMGARHTYHDRLVTILAAVPAARIADCGVRAGR